MQNNYVFGNKNTLTALRDEISSCDEICNDIEQDEDRLYFVTDKSIHKTVYSFLNNQECSATYVYIDSISGEVVFDRFGDTSPKHHEIDGESYWNLIAENEDIQKWVDGLEPVDDAFTAFYERETGKLFLLDRRTEDIQDWIFNNVYLPKVG